MKKETKKRCLCLFGLVVLCLSGVFRVQIKAEDAFVVEEQAIIGGDAWQGETQPVDPFFSPAVAPTEEQKKYEKAAPTLSEIPETEEATVSSERVRKNSVSENSISENSVSQNMIAKSSPPPVFQVPDLKQTEKKMKSQPEKFMRNQTASEETQESLQREISQPHRKNPWWLLVISAVFFLGGCARLVWKCRDCRGNGALYV